MRHRITSNSSRDIFQKNKNSWKRCLENQSGAALILSILSVGILVTSLFLAVGYKVSEWESTLQNHKASLAGVTAMQELSVVASDAYRLFLEVGAGNCPVGTQELAYGVDAARTNSFCMPNPLCVSHPLGQSLIAANDRMPLCDTAADSYDGLDRVNITLSVPKPKNFFEKLKREYQVAKMYLPGLPQRVFRRLFQRIAQAQYTPLPDLAAPAFAGNNIGTGAGVINAPGAANCQAPLGPGANEFCKVCGENMACLTLRLCLNYRGCNDDLDWHIQKIGFKTDCPETTVTYTDDGIFVLPPHCRFLRIESRGGGGAAGQRSSVLGQSGRGGGGGYVRANRDNTPSGLSFQIFVGKGGSNFMCDRNSDGGAGGPYPGGRGGSRALGYNNIPVPGTGPGIQGGPGLGALNGEAGAIGRAGGGGGGGSGYEGSTGDGTNYYLVGGGGGGATSVVEIGPPAVEVLRAGGGGGGGAGSTTNPAGARGGDGGVACSGGGTDAQTGGVPPSRSGGGGGAGGCFLAPSYSAGDSAILNGPGPFVLWPGGWRGAAENPALYGRGGVSGAGGFCPQPNGRDGVVIFTFSRDPIVGPYALAP